MQTCYVSITLGPHSSFSNKPMPGWNYFHDGPSVPSWAPTQLWRHGWWGALADFKLTGLPLKLPLPPSSADPTCSMNSNTAGVAMVAGASSMIFWCRRWMEQSRPNRDTAFPYWSARIWTSRWRAFWASFMRKMGEPGISLCTWWGRQSGWLFPGQPGLE